jgi:hypothetical protein
VREAAGRTRPAVARDEVDPAQAGAQDLAEHREEPVARGLARRLVDPAQPMDVEEDDRRLLFVAQAPLRLHLHRDN